MSYVRETLHGNFGVSLVSKRPVTTEIGEALWPTVILVGTATTLSMVIGILIGIHAGWRRRSKFDVGSTTFSMFTYSVPDFWLGMVCLGLFSFKLGLFPTGGMEDSGSNATGLANLKAVAEKQG